MRNRAVAAIESLSWRTCYLCTGLRMSWCGLAHFMGWRRAVWLFDAILHRREPDHCRRSYDWWNMYDRKPTTYREWLFQMEEK